MFFPRPFKFTMYQFSAQVPMELSMHEDQLGSHHVDGSGNFDVWVAHREADLCSQLSNSFWKHGP